MDTKYLADSSHLIDFNKVEVWIEISECMEEYSHPTVGMDVLCNLFKWIKENYPNLKFYKLDPLILDSLVEKLEKNKEDIFELDRYIKEASDKFKEYKGCKVSDITKIGVSRKSFLVTLDELINFYKGLEILEEEYEVINKSAFIIWSMGSYYKNINSIKSMLERRLIHALINR